MKFKTLLLLFTLLSSFTAFAQINPKWEMRGIWMASLGIDWPRSVGTSASTINSQKNELIGMLDKHKLSGMNAIFFHVRPQCDAVYKSNIEPWSQYLTGKQGLAPTDTSYDPLTFAIQESHKRGMELHAWLNPYRALLSGGSVSSIAANNVINQHPEWIIKCNGSEYRFLDPGLPQVRAYVTDVIVDILKRYDVDGIHFDDYFYPYSDYGTFNDDATFAKYPNGFTSKSAWRYNNVNLLLKMINDSVKYYKPWVRFGISPSGNNSVNIGIYVDSDPWLAGTYTDTLGVAKTGDPYIDYILPQLYWVDFGGHLPEWSGVSYLNGRHLYIGHAAYRYNESTFSPTECGYQINKSRATATSRGGVYFSSQSLINNLAGCQDSVRHLYYANESLVPQMPWLPGSKTKPNAPTNFKRVLNTANSKYEFQWDKPAIATDGDTAFFYIVYRFQAIPTDLSSGNNIFGTTGELSLKNDYARYSATKGGYYVVTAVDRYGNESAMSNVLNFDDAAFIPDVPTLVSPSNGDQSQSVSTTLKWRKSAKAESYIIYVSTDSTFATNTELFYMEMKDTVCKFSGLEADKTYYWRVKACAFAESQFSNVFSFQAGFPSTPVLVFPAHASVNVPTNTVFKWNATARATSYHFMLSTSSTFNPASSTVMDVTVADTTVQAQNLAVNKVHYWKVQAINSMGSSNWPTTFGFKTGTASDVNTDILAPKVYELKQNYPNPFNPTTKITYSIAKAGMVSIKVYNVLGSEVATLVNREMSAGTYSVDFPGISRQLPSGIYFYKLVSGNFTDIKKMLLLK